MTLLALLIAVVLLLSAERLIRRHQCVSLGSRACQGLKWRREIRNTSTRRVRQFLGVVGDAFGLNQQEVLKLRPDDQVLWLYRLVNPSNCLPDGLELETLADALKHQYGLALPVVMPEKMTLGTLFSSIQQDTSDPGPVSSV